MNEYSLDDVLSLGETAGEEYDVRHQPALSVACLSSSGMLRVVHPLTLLSQLSLSATFPPSLHSALQDRLAEGVVSSHVPEPLQFASLDCGK